MSSNATCITETISQEAIGDRSAIIQERWYMDVIRVFTMTWCLNTPLHVLFALRRTLYLTLSYWICILRLIHTYTCSKSYESTNCRISITYLAKISLIIEISTSLYLLTLQITGIYTICILGNYDFSNTWSFLFLFSISVLCNSL